MRYIRLLLIGITAVSMLVSGGCISTALSRPVPDQSEPVPASSADASAVPAREIQGDPQSASRPKTGAAASLPTEGRQDDDSTRSETNASEAIKGIAGLVVGVAAAVILIPLLVILSVGAI